MKFCYNGASHWWDLLMKMSSKRQKKLEEKNMKNHEELMEQVTWVDESTKKALDIAIKNVADVRKIELKQQWLKEEITEELMFNAKEKFREKLNSTD